MYKKELESDDTKARLIRIKTQFAIIESEFINKQNQIVQKTNRLNTIKKQLVNLEKSKGFPLPQFTTFTAQLALEEKQVAESKAWWESVQNLVNRERRVINITSKIIDLGQINKTLTSNLSSSEIGMDFRLTYRQLALLNQGLN